MLTNVLKGWRRQRTATSEAWTTDSQSLIEICERYWASPCELVATDTGEDGLQAQYDRARRELLARFEECAAWAVELSAHPESQPRSLGLDLLARAAHAGALGEYEDAAVRAFLETLDRPMRARWDQIALEAAIGALGVRGDECAIPALIRILRSEDREHQGDTHWAAAAALERLTGQSFLHAPKPVEAARHWARQSAESFK